jgi:hypothetical protein
MMTEYKIQHFVPQWYQKNFASDLSKKQIWVHDIRSGELAQQTIYETAQEDDFYGVEFEKFLNPFEQNSAELIKKILTIDQLKQLSPVSIGKLHQFFTLQMHRTKTSKIIADNAVKRHLEIYIKPKYNLLFQDQPEKNAYIKNLDLSDIDFFKHEIKMALASSEALSDLKFFLIENNTKIPFITSDDPITVNDYFFKKKGYPGLFSPGLQLFCPVTPRITLALIHDDVYHVQTNSDQKIILTLEADVNYLNSFQFLKCNKQIISDKNYSSYYSTLQKTIAEIQFESKSVKSLEEINYGIHFSFIRFNPKSSQKMTIYSKIGQNAQRSGKTRINKPIRNEAIFDSVIQKTEDIIQDFLVEINSLQSTQ